MSEKEEKERLLREVERLQKEASYVFKLNVPFTSTSITTAPIFVSDPLAAAKKSVPPAYAEIKVWHADGRVEIVRCESFNLLINGSARGASRSEGDAVQFTGKLRAWKFGPDGRPKL